MSPVFYLLCSFNERLSITDPRIHITIFGDSNVQNHEWMLLSSGKSIMEHEAAQVAVVNNISHLDDLSTNISDRDGRSAHPLDLILTSVLSI